MQTLQITLQIIIPICIVALSAWVNIKIKYAVDEAQAKQNIKHIFLTIMSWVFVLYLIASIIWQFSLQEPVTRSSLIMILVPLFALSCLFTLWWTDKLIDIISVISRVMGVQADFSKKHFNITSDILKKVESSEKK